MFGAIQRLVLIALGTVFVTAIAITFVRWAGSHQSFSEPPHPWFAYPSWTVKKPDLEQLCETLKLSEPIADTDLIWLPVAFAEGNWRVKCAKPTRIGQLIGNSTHLNWLVYVEANQTTHLDSLVEEIAPFDKHALGVLAPSQTVARYLRKKAPQWVYGADAATLLRLHMFTSFWLETAFDFWPDFVVQSPHDKLTQLSERELGELGRRKKRVIQFDIIE